MEHREIVEAILDREIYLKADGTAVTTEAELQDCPDYQAAFKRIYQTVRLPAGTSGPQAFAALHEDVVKSLAYSTEENAWASAWVLNPEGVPFEKGFGDTKQWVEGARILLDNGRTRFIEGGIPGAKTGSTCKVGPFTKQVDVTAGFEGTIYKAGGDTEITVKLEDHGDALPLYIPAAANQFTVPGKGIWREWGTTKRLSLEAEGFNSVSIPIVGVVGSEEHDVRANDFDQVVKAQAFIGPGVKVQIKAPFDDISRVFMVPAGSAATAFANAIKGQRFVAAVRFGATHPSSPADFEGIDFDAVVADLQAQGLLIPQKNNPDRLEINFEGATPIQGGDGVAYPRRHVMIGDTPIHTMRQKMKDGVLVWDMGRAVSGDNEAPLHPGRNPGVNAQVVANPWIVAKEGTDFHGNPSNVGAFFAWEADLRGREVEVPAATDVTSVPDWVRALDMAAPATPAVGE